MSRSRVDQGLGFFESCGNGFFDKNVDAVFEKIDADPGVMGGRNRQADSINFAEDVVVIGKRRGFV